MSKKIKLLFSIALCFITINTHLNAEIKNIIFDIGEVLFHTKIPALKYAAQTNAWNQDFMCGKTSDSEALEAILKEISQESNHQVVIDFWGNVTNEIKLLESGLSLLKAAKESGYKVYLFSNAPKEFHEKLKEKYKFLENLFNGEIISCYCNLRKPDPRIYKCLFRTYNLNPKECLFIDDREENIEAGAKLNMPGIIWLPGQQAKTLINTKMPIPLHQKFWEILHPYLVRSKSKWIIPAGLIE